jgi:hypothetical protein
VRSATPTGFKVVMLLCENNPLNSGVFYQSKFETPSLGSTNPPQMCLEIAVYSSVEMWIWESEKPYTLEKGGRTVRRAMDVA